MPASAIAIAFSACDDETMAPGVAVELPAPDAAELAAVTEAHAQFAAGNADNVQAPAPDVHGKGPERFERLQPTVEVGRSQRLIEESIQDALDRQHYSGTTTYYLPGRVI